LTGCFDHAASNVIRFNLPPAISQLLKTAAELLKVEFKLPPAKEKESGMEMQ